MLRHLVTEIGWLRFLATCFIWKTLFHVRSSKLPKESLLQWIFDDTRAPYTPFPATSRTGCRSVWWSACSQQPEHISGGRGTLLACWVFTLSLNLGSCPDWYLIWYSKMLQVITPMSHIVNYIFWGRVLPRSPRSVAGAISRPCWESRQRPVPHVAGSAEILVAAV